MENEKELVEFFNTFFVNDAGETPLAEADILRIKEIYKPIKSFDFPKGNSTGINKIIKSLNPKKATGSDRIKSKFMKKCSNTINAHSTNILSNDILNSLFSEEAKTANVIYIKKIKKE